MTDWIDLTEEQQNPAPLSSLLFLRGTKASVLHFTNEKLPAASIALTLHGEPRQTVLGKFENEREKFTAFCTFFTYPLSLLGEILLLYTHEYEDGPSEKAQLAELWFADYLWGLGQTRATLHIENNHLPLAAQATYVASSLILSYDFLKEGKELVLRATDKKSERYTVELSVSTSSIERLRGMHAMKYRSQFERFVRIPLYMLAYTADLLMGLLDSGKTQLVNEPLQQLRAAILLLSSPAENPPPRKLR